MKKLPTLYQRDSETGLVVDVFSSIYLARSVIGLGIATVKIDGTCCRVTHDGVLWKRYERRPMKKWRKMCGPGFSFWAEHARDAPDEWEECQPAPDPNTGLWPGWLPVDGQNPTDKWHMEALGRGPLRSGTYELVGPRIQGNPYRLTGHLLVKHGDELSRLGPGSWPDELFADLRAYLATAGEEGIVWRVLGAPVAKIKASDFGLDWKGKASENPPPEEMKTLE